MDNQHQKIKGYRDLNQEEIDLMNEGKALSVKVGEFCDKLGKTPVDQRWLAIARTELQKSFMFLIRSIAKPETF